MQLTKLNSMQLTQPIYYATTSQVLKCFQATVGLSHPKALVNRQIYRWAGCSQNDPGLVGKPEAAVGAVAAIKGQDWPELAAGSWLAGAGSSCFCPVAVAAATRVGQ